MEKIKLEIVGLSYSQTQSGAYALVLGESEGKRRLPIVIGGFEAQAIAIEEKRNGTRRRKERGERKSSIYLKKIIAIWFYSAISASPRKKEFTQVN